MNISYINFHFPRKCVSYDYFWLSVKCFIEDNYKGENTFNWNYPIISSSYNSINDIVNQLLEEDPDVLMVSLYVWNQALTHEVVKQLKKIKKDLIVVAGGPHIESRPDYFLINNHIDFACQTDGYGEPFMNEFLYQLETDNDWSSVPYMLHKTVKSNIIYNKRDFVWPKKIFHRNKEYLTHQRELADKLGYIFDINYESSRGCPYGCTYCEWGGGINSKVSFKPLEEIQDDLSFIISTIRPEILGITDANFGIHRRDLDIAKSICENKVKHGYPKSIELFGSSKSKKEVIYKIEELFVQHKLVDELKISAQDLNPEVNINIKRTDSPWQSDLIAKREIQKKYDDVRLRLELILGLPGMTISDFYDAFDIMCKENMYTERYLWYMLPTAPASELDYIEKHGIKTITVEKVLQTENQNDDCLLDNYVSPTDIVVQTNDYTSDEWIEMYIMNILGVSGEVDGFLKHISRYINDVMEIPYSTFYKEYFKFLTNYAPESTREIFTDIISDLKQRVDSGYCKDVEEFSAPYPWNNIKLDISRLHKMAIHLNREEFYHSLKLWTIEKFGKDDALIDLINWNKDMIMFIDYDPLNPLSFYSDHDWWSWIHGGDLKKITTINTPRDTHRKTRYDDNLEIDWYKYDIDQRIQKYFIQICYEAETYSLFKKLETTYEKDTAFNDS